MFQVMLQKAVLVQRASLEWWKRDQSVLMAQVRKEIDLGLWTSGEKSRILEPAKAAVTTSKFNKK